MNYLILHILAISILFLLLSYISYHQSGYLATAFHCL